MDPRFPAREDVVLPEMLAREAKRRPDQVFAVFPDARWTYEETAARAWSAANALRRLGVAQGDFVSSWLPNGPHALLSWFGANALGATYAPLNPAYRGAMLEHTVNYSGASVMVVHADLVERLSGLDLPTLTTLVVVGELRAQPPAGLEVVPASVLEEGAPERPETERPIEPWDIIALIYTSGTTGPSKAVLCPHLHHYTYAEQLFVYADHTDRFFACLPMFHTGGTTAVYGMLRLGASVAITDGFRTSTFLEEARQYGTTRAVILGAMANFLLAREERPDDADNPIRMAIVTPMVADVEGFRSRFGIDVLAAYGLTEATCPLRSEPNPVNWRSCGRLSSPDYELRLVDEHDREVSIGEVGQLVIRHDRPWSLSLGYRGMPEATADVWRNGWFHTGDSMRRDAEGNYYFVDRAKDALRRRGENISSMEVERELLAHPEIIEAAVVAAPADEAEDEVHAFVVRRPESSLSPAALIEWLVPRMAHFMVPRYIDFVDGLPVTESQKVQKFRLRQIGVTSATWDREAAGIRLRRDRLASA
jgi:crotonobetaine/carnitine-CoA ligase